MATKNEVKGVTSKMKRPVVIPVPYRPENQFISKEQFLKNRAAEKAANKAAEEARIRVLKEAGQTQSLPEAPIESESDKQIQLLRRQLANAQKQLSEKPDSKSWKNKVKTLSEELEVLEAESID